MRGTSMPMPPTNLLIYRFYELVMVNGPPGRRRSRKSSAEAFGQAIMSAIDFDLTIEHRADPKSGRVRINTSGKFLAFKFYGSTGKCEAVRHMEE